MTPGSEAPARRRTAGRAPGPRLVLASASARRRDILDQLGLRYELRAPKVEEAWDPDEAPAAAAVRIAAAKAASVPRAPEEIVLAADTLVAVDGHLLGKPRDGEEAIEMLLRLAGREHSVFTGLALAHGGSLEAAADETRVWFRLLDRSECAEYVATGESMDKAGAYAIQGYGSTLVRRIEGDYFNVMGLPVHLLLSLLARLGVRYSFGRLVSG